MRSSVPTLLLLGLVIALPLNAAAQIDPDPDGIGIYADQAATFNHVTVPPGIPAQVWLIFTRVSHSNWGMIEGWECLVSHTPNVQVVQWYLSDGTNFATPPDFLVYTMHEGWPVGPRMLMMRISYSVSNALPAAFFVTGSAQYDILEDGLPGYSTDSWHHFPLYPSSGGTDLAVFVVNGEPPVSRDARTWGGVKRLFE